MPTSGPGSSAAAPAPAAARGFTLLELLVVLAIVAVSVATVSLALRDGSATRLERDGVRLAALLEMARTESRVSGTPVLWVPGAPAVNGRPLTDGAEAVDFQFVGLSPKIQMPVRWLDPRITAEVQGRPVMALGPDAILPPQRVVLRLDDQRLEVATDGLSPFAIADGAPAAPVSR
jgi:general secretion pathway protein H